jgi:hypothetical protein
VNESVDCSSGVLAGLFGFLLSNRIATTPVQDSHLVPARHTGLRGRACASAVPPDANDNILSAPAHMFRAKPTPSLLLIRTSIKQRIRWPRVNCARYLTRRQVTQTRWIHAEVLNNAGPGGVVSTSSTLPRARLLANTMAPAGLSIDCASTDIGPVTFMQQAARQTTMETLQVTTSTKFRALRPHQQLRLCHRCPHPSHRSSDGRCAIHRNGDTLAGFTGSVTLGTTGLPTVCHQYLS